MRSCWEIRRALLSLSPSTDVWGDGDADLGKGASRQQWRLQCEDCPIRFSLAPCWEQCGGADCCCAPIHVTCDFCALYIEHRREIARLVRDGSAAAELRQTPGEVLTSAETMLTIAIGGASTTMERLQLSVPDMYADHHVLRARSALTALPGVEDVVASSAFRVITLSFDPALTSPGVIMAELEDVGYAVATNGTGVVASTVPFADGRRDPAWFRLGARKTRTDERDLKTQR